jgi:signal peptidase I
MSAKCQGRLRRFWREWLRPLLAVAVVLGSFRSAIADWNDVPSGSMIPTILEGDRVFVDRIAYDLKIPFTTKRLAHWSDPIRGDVVVLVSPYDGRRLLKRVVAVPGDVLSVQHGRLTINGEEARYAPVGTDARRLIGREAEAFQALAVESIAGRSHLVLRGREDWGPIVVPEGRYFLMGDHRDDSFDSRYWGFAERRLILGRVTAVALSVDLHHGWRPRWQRFFSAVQ